MIKLFNAFITLLLYLVFTLMLSICVPLLICLLISLSTEQNIGSLINTSGFMFFSVCFGIFSAIYLSYFTNKLN